MLETKTWHKVTLTTDGPWAHERDTDHNPFTDFSCEVKFEHESGSPSYLVPGYFAADGNAAETSAQSGTKWRAHLSPDVDGVWKYTVSLKGPDGKDAIGNGATGEIEIEPSDKDGRDFLGRGRLKYVGKSI